MKLESGAHGRVVGRPQRRLGAAQPQVRDLRLDGNETVAAVKHQVNAAIEWLTMPDELKRALAEDRSLRRWFDRLNHSTRNEISKRMPQGV